MQELLDLIRPNYIRGLTFSGGDPLFVQNRLIVGYICERVRKEFGDTKDIWMWTGYEWDDIKDWDHLHYIDVLVDGPYIEAERDISLPWAGSKNQRVIDVKKSLERGGCTMEIKDWVILLGMITIVLTGVNVSLLSKYVYKLEDRIKALEIKEN